MFSILLGALSVCGIGHSENCNHVYDRAFNYVMDNEGGLNHHKYDTGGITNFGISLSFLKAEGIDINEDGKIDGEDIIVLDRDKAYDLYRTHFWNKLGLNLLDDTDLAIFIFDMAVNVGSHTIVYLLQKLLFCDRDIEIDGILGTDTLKRLNAMSSNTQFKSNLVAILKGHYIKLCLKNPKLRVFFKGWINRVERGELFFRFAP